MGVALAGYRVVIASRPLMLDGEEQWLIVDPETREIEIDGQVTLSHANSLLEEVAEMILGCQISRNPFHRRI